MYRKYVFKPTGMFGVNAQLPRGMVPSVYGTFAFENILHTINCKTVQGSAQKRPGYTNHNTSTASGVPITMGRFTVRKNAAAAYPHTDYNFWMTTSDFCQDRISTHASHNTETWKYLTPTTTYTTTAQVDSITGTAVVFEGAATLQTDGIAAGDKFILEEDFTDDEEADVSWRTIAAVPTETTLTLTAAYEDNKASPAGEDARIRKVYTGPGTNGSWGWCIVNDTLIFCNKNDNVQKFSPTDTYASDVDSTNALKWHHCIEYANRAVLANEEGVDRISLKWSKENDPTDWTDTTAGSVSLQTSGSEITGLGKVGSYLVAFTPTSMLFGYRTGISTAPIAFQDENVGIGAYAPSSIVHANGTVYFMGQQDFYMLQGTNAVPIGSAIREELFPNESDDDLKIHKGIHNAPAHEIWWFKSHSQYAYVYDYLNGIWNVYYFGGDSMYLHTGSMGLKELNDTDNVLLLGLSSLDLSTTTKTAIHSSAYVGDNSTIVYFGYRTATSDFSDQDPEALGRWKIVHRVRLLYKDLSEDTAFTATAYIDDSNAGNQVGSAANTVGTGAGYMDSTDFDEAMTGNFFSFNITSNSATTKAQLIGIEVYYELGGVFFAI